MRNHTLCPFIKVYDGVDSFGDKFIQYGVIDDFGNWVKLNQTQHLTILLCCV